MIYENELICIELEKSEIPWVKVFTKKEFKEISDVDDVTRKWLFEAALITEKTMLDFYCADKINWASFANYVPKVHIHVQARFKDDSFFPESMWGTKQRDGTKRDLNIEKFTNQLVLNLKNYNFIKK
ncbi:HIT family protein [Campylobacter fetus]|uniref:HIT family protein n=4 Tax=Campylobacter fetus TaxID=196 RepID=A0A5L4IEP4_CAMFE|nr:MULTISPECIES: HIT domain-containing protein [Campylobacter]OCS22507.1 histidine triad (HIT) protein [Campylobacter fetus subsp. venerealis cfvi97/532]OCS26505.1 histidine triad (HIT) protein [Campylobacter fetus subsp. venerealis cfvB10]OCS29902.1 histidine triad (HIT) protein [Campylobacter fetus subsp. venerealis LMG 6570 = CCUG 33900]OCS43211.1 histidine triad (HIT) protein [Campylobacter fetus subsp. venerealis cfvi02/298]ABK82277.1 HIT family protein [Campylobacter fetus subsp. fetus 8